MDDLIPFLCVLLSGGCVGVSVWFFFLQSPLLFKLLGRKKFVPLMMSMTKLYSSVMFFVTLSVFVMYRVPILLTFIPHLQKKPDVILAFLQSKINFELIYDYSFDALMTVFISHFFVIPSALAAGRESAAERAHEDSKSVKDFVVEGGSKTKTSTKHRLVVVFVLLHTFSLCMFVLSITTNI
jgi:hypothetical protein